jgi:hypothetical protein
MSKVIPSQIVGFLDERFPTAKNDNPDDKVGMGRLGQIRALLRFLDDLPGELVMISGPEYAAFIDSIEELRSAIALWSAHGLADKVTNPRKVARSLSQIRRLLLTFPDSAIPASTGDLAFISDATLRESIRGDMAAANAALHNGEWKAATVLAGSAVEGLLLWAVEQKPHNARQVAVAALVTRGTANGGLSKAPSGAPDTWGLAALVLVAGELGITDKEVTRQALCAKDARNLVHPGRAKLSNKTGNRGSALTGCAAVEQVAAALARP